MPCLDTTVLIDLRPRRDKTRQAAARQKLSALVAAMEPVYITRFNVAELYVGVARSRDAVAERAAVDAIAAQFPILEFTNDAAVRYGAVMAAVQRVGRPIDHLDALIAAVCLANGQRLVTRNPRHFADVPGLTVETYGP